MKTIFALCALVALMGCGAKTERYKIIAEPYKPTIKIDTETGQTWEYKDGVWKPIPSVP
jgi:hypothetical protein